MYVSNKLKELFKLNLEKPSVKTFRPWYSNISISNIWYSFGNKGYLLRKKLKLYLNKISWEEIILLFILNNVDISKLVYTPKIRLKNIKLEIFEEGISINFCIKFLNLQFKHKYILNYVLRVNINLINPSLFVTKFPSQAVPVYRKLKKYPVY